MKKYLGIFIIILGLLLVGCSAEKPEIGELSCSLSINCAAVLADLADFDPNKIELLPEDGMLLAVTEVKFSQGETALELIKRECQARGIHFEVSADGYIKGIGNIYEFDCGDVSGWLYKVNGEFAVQGASDYQVQPGDALEWFYSCDFGADLGF